MPHYNTVKRTTVLLTRLDNRRRRQQTYSTFHISYLQHKQPVKPRAYFNVPTGTDVLGDLKSVLEGLVTCA